MSRRRVQTALTAATAVALVAAAGLDESNRERLRGMPHDQRAKLSKRLDEFDALDGAERTAVRELDAQIAELPEEDRANYYAVMRRYYLWLMSLPEARRNELNALPPGERMKAVTALVAQQPPRTTPTFFQVAELGGSSPYELANRLKLWLVLTRAQRQEVERVAPGPARQKRLQELARDVKFEPIPRPGRVDETLRPERLAKSRMGAALKRFDNLNKDDRRQRLAEHVYLAENPPARVNAENLGRFLAALPAPVRAQFDALPPEEARRRLAILYRLIFPPPSEFREAPPPVPAAGKPAAPAPPDATKSATGTSPF